MSHTTEFLEMFRNGILYSINTAMPAEILSYDESKGEAKIQPLFKIKDIHGNEKKLSAIEGVPVLKHRFKVNGGAPQEYVPVYSNGETVLVVFSQRALDDASQGKLVYPGTSRMFSIHDAVIVGVF